jgi:voltage-gated potassium channel
MSVAEEPSPVIADEVSYYLPPGWIRPTIMAALRVFVIGSLIVMGSTFTVGIDRLAGFIWLVDLLLLAIWLTVFVAYLRWQLRRIAASGFPLIRGAETIAIGLVIVVSAFAKSYLLMSITDPAAFNEDLTPFTAYYFTISTLSTVGFGDISAETDAARAIVMLQMIIGLALIAGIVRLVVIALRISARRHGLREQRI